MNKIIKFTSMLMASSIMLMGCGQKEYYNAIRTQNETIVRINAQREAEREKEERLHEEKMSMIMQSAMNAAAKTPDVTDDVLLPVLFMNMENQRTLAKVLTADKNKSLQLQKIKAPDSFGDNVRKSTGMILGIGGIILGVTQSHNMKDVAIAGINGAGNKMNVTGDNNSVISDSYKNGTDNTITGSNDTAINITSNEMTEPKESEEPEEATEATEPEDAGTE